MSAPITYIFNIYIGTHNGPILQRYSAHVWSKDMLAHRDEFPGTPSQAKPPKQFPVPQTTAQLVGSCAGSSLKWDGSAQLKQRFRLLIGRIDPGWCLGV